MTNDVMSIDRVGRPSNSPSWVGLISDSMLIMISLLVPRLFEYGLRYPFIIPTSGGRNLKAEGGTSMRRRVFVDYSVRGGLGIGRK